MFNSPVYPNLYPNNCLTSPQQRIEQLINQHPQYFNQNTQAAFNNQPGWKIIPVSNIEEANATSADLMGNPTFFFNRVTKEIYMKQLDDTGAAPLIVFGMKTQNIQPQSSKDPAYDFQSKLEEVNKKVDEIKRVLVPKNNNQGNKPKKDI